MAEQELAAPEGGEGEVVAPEEVVTPEPENEPESPSLEAVAKELGWRPKDEFKGNPDDWKSADDFIRAGRDIQRSMASEIKEVKSTLSNMSRVTDTIMEEALRKQRDELLAGRDEAIEAGDKDAVRAFDARLNQVTAPAVSTPPETESFKQRNSWFGKDPMATNYAVQVCEMNKNLPAAEQLRIAEEEVKKRFPEHFPQARETKPQAQVAEPSSRGPGRKSNGKSFSDMPKEAQDMAIHLENTRGIDRERYTKSWFEREGTRA